MQPWLIVLLASEWTLSVNAIILRSIEAVVSLLGSLKIVARLRAHHYHLLPHCLSKPLLPSPSVPFLHPLHSLCLFYSPSIFMAFYLFILLTLLFFSVSAFYYSSWSKQMFVRKKKTDQSIFPQVKETDWACADCASVLVTSVQDKVQASSTHHAALWISEKKWCVYLFFCSCHAFRKKSVDRHRSWKCHDSACQAIESFRCEKKNIMKENISWLSAESWRTLKTPLLLLKFYICMRVTARCVHSWTFTLQLSELFGKKGGHGGDNETSSSPLAYNEEWGLRSHWAALQQRH